MNFSIRRLINILVVSSSLSLLILGVSAIVSSVMMNNTQKDLIDVMKIKTLSSNISNLIVADIARQQKYSDNEREGRKIPVELVVRSDMPFYSFYNELKQISVNTPSINKVIPILNKEYDIFTDSEMLIIQNVNNTIDLRNQFRQQTNNLDKAMTNIRIHLSGAEQKLKTQFLEFLVYVGQLKNGVAIEGVNESPLQLAKQTADILSKTITSELAASEPNSDKFKNIKQVEENFNLISELGYKSSNSVYHLKQLLEENENTLLDTRKAIFKSVIRMGELLGDLKKIVDDMSEHIVEFSKELSVYILGIISILSVIFLVVFFYLGKNILTTITTSLNRVVNAMGDIASGKRGLEKTVTVPPQKELAKLSTSFNEMITQLRQSQIEMQATNSAYQKFVPMKGLEILGKKSITEIKLGDHAECNMSVLFSDIRDFTTITENMTTSESFEFVNEYLAVMEPVIEKYNGFIDKYIGDAVMALFPEPGGAENAIRAGLAMMEALEELNAMRMEREDEPVKIGVGINTGSLVLGTIGGNVRMEETVIGDTVNVASRMESLNKQFGTQILISEATYKCISKKFNLSVRHIGFTAIKGKADRAKAFEVYQHCPDDMVVQKTKVAAKLLEGCMIYEKEKLIEARAIFDECKMIAPNDPVVDYYVSIAGQVDRRKDKE